jgi:hypothetical protein
MKHVLAPTREDQEDREGEWIMVAVETVIDPVASQSLSRETGKGLKWYKGKGTGSFMV